MNIETDAAEVTIKFKRTPPAIPRWSRYSYQISIDDNSVNAKLRILLVCRDCGAKIHNYEFKTPLMFTPSFADMIDDVAIHESEHLAGERI